VLRTKHCVETRNEGIVLLLWGPIHKSPGFVNNAGEFFGRDRAEVENPLASPPRYDSSGYSWCGGGLYAH
jgi:hypothetical protein